MENKTEPIIIKEDIMIPIYLCNGNFEANEELLPVIQRTALTLGFSTMKYFFTITIIFSFYVGSYAQTWRPRFSLPLGGELAATMNYQNLNEYLERNVSQGSNGNCSVELSVFTFRVNYLGKIDSVYADGNLNMDATKEVIKNIYKTDGKWRIPDNSQTKDKCWFAYPFFIFGEIRPCSVEKRDYFNSTYALYQLYSNMAESEDKTGKVIIAPNRFAKLEEK